MNLGEMFINSLYLLGTVIVAVAISDLVMKQIHKAVMAKAINKAIKEGQVYVRKCNGFDDMEDEERDHPEA